MLINSTFGGSTRIVDLRMVNNTTLAIQTRQIGKLERDTVKKSSAKVKELKKSEKEKNLESNEFEFLTKLPVIKTFILGIESIVKGVSKLVN